MLGSTTSECLADGLEFERLRVVAAFEALLRRASMTWLSCNGGAPDTVELLVLPVLGAGGGDRDGRGGGADWKGGERILARWSE